MKSKCGFGELFGPVVITAIFCFILGYSAGVIDCRKTHKTKYGFVVDQINTYTGQTNKLWIIP